MQDIDIYLSDEIFHFLYSNIEWELTAAAPTK